MKIIKKQRNKAVMPCRQTDEVQSAIDYGIDISQLLENIHRSPTERVRRHQNALNLVEKLQKARYQ